MKAVSLRIASDNLMTRPIERKDIPFRQLLEISPVFSSLSSVPPESTIIRCLKDSKILDRRMILTTHINEEGGAEVRRKDWRSVNERLRLYTSFQWGSRSVYIVGLSSCFIFL